MTWRSGVLSLAGLGVAALRGAAEVLLVECSAPELDFFARELQAQLPVRVAKVLLKDLVTTVRRQGRPGHWAAAVTSFGHLPGVERRLEGLGVPVLALLGGGASRDPPAPGSAAARGAGGRDRRRRGNDPQRWSTRSPLPPCRTSRGSRRAPPRGPR